MYLVLLELVVWLEVHNLVAEESDEVAPFHNLISYHTW